MRTKVSLNYVAECEALSVRIKAIGENTTGVDWEGIHKIAGRISRYAKQEYDKEVASKMMPKTSETPTASTVEVPKVGEPKADSTLEQIINSNSEPVAPVTLVNPITV